MTLSPFLFLCLAFLSLGLGMLVHLKARPGAVRAYFTIFSLSATVWLASGFLLYSNIAPQHAVLWAKLAFVASAGVIPSLYHLLLLFPDLERARFGQFVNAASGALAGLALLSPWLVASVSVRGPYSIEVRYGPLFPLLTAFAVFVAGFGIHALMRRLRAASGLRRLQMQYLLAGTVVPVAGVFVTNLICPLVFDVVALAPYGRFLAVVFLPVTAHAIVRHRLMDIRLFVRNATVYGCAMATAACVFGGLLWFIGSLVPSEGTSLARSVALAVIVAILFDPAKTAIDRALNRYLYRESRDYQRLLAESSRRLRTMLDPASMARCLSGLVSAIFSAELAAVYLRDELRDGLTVAAVQRCLDPQDPVAPGFVPMASPLVALLEGGQGIVIRDEMLRSPTSPLVSAAAAQLEELGGALAIALRHSGGEVSGLLVVGPKLSGDPYFSGDVDFLVMLVPQAAVSIENLGLYRQVEEERLRTSRLAFLESLAAGIAHEIKNPLVALRTFAELLPERLHDADFHGEFARIAVNEIERIDGLVTRLRDLATRPEQQCEPVELRQPIDEMLLLLRGRFEQNGVSVERHYRRRRLAVLGDPNLLKQLFLNLFVNALDAMPAGGRLTIALAAKQAHGDPLLVAEVTDTGEGIPADLLPRVFNPFVSTKPGGSGLGLSICRSIADAHRARIRIHNNASGRGVTVGLEFPLLADRTDGRLPRGAPPGAGAGHEIPIEVGVRSSLP